PFLIIGKSGLRLGDAVAEVAHGLQLLLKVRNRFLESGLPIEITAEYSRRSVEKDRLDLVFSKIAGIGKSHLIDANPLALGDAEPDQVHVVGKMDGTLGFASHEVKSRRSVFRLDQLDDAIDGVGSGEDVIGQQPAKLVRLEDVIAGKTVLKPLAHTHQDRDF